MCACKFYHVTPPVKIVRPCGDRSKSNWCWLWLVSQYAFAFIFASASTSLASERFVHFADDFGPESRGERQRNIVADAPPEGLGYPTETPHGFAPKNWIIADAEPSGPRRSFWCIPESADGKVGQVMQQAGRSRNSIAFARTMIPASLERFSIEFRQRAADNDYIGFVIGATQPRMQHDGFEFGYERQEPGTDRTSDDLYYRGDLGEGCVAGAANMRRWVSHRIEVDGQTVKWYQDGTLTLSGTTQKRLAGGYFGFRQSYERNTEYDEVRITTNAAPATTGPNVLFIAIDDLRNDLGCYGVQQVVSPHIDQLAAKGVMFNRAYCQYPLCNPSRASVLTGLRPDNTGMNRNEIQNRFHFREKVPNVETLPQLFQRSGYRVGRIGKLYHYGVPREIGTESLLDDRASWQFALYPRGGEVDEESRLISYTPSRHSGWALSWQESITPAVEHTDAKVADAAIAKLQELKDERFFLAVGFYRPHVPSIAPPEDFAAYPLEAISLPDEPPAHRDNIPDAASPSVMQVHAAPADLRRFKRAYYATVTFVDKQVGRLLESLDQLGLTDDTVVVLWGDHGWMLGEHGEWTKPYLFEECARAPLIIHAPNMNGNGQTCDRIVEFVDVYPTLAELCSLTPPADLDGQSLVPLLQSPDRTWTDEAFTQVASNHATGYSIRTDRWRYIEWDDGRSGRELYDHTTDEHEHRNLAESAEHADVVRDLSRRLAAMRSKVR